VGAPTEPPEAGSHIHPDLTHCVWFACVGERRSSLPVCVAVHYDSGGITTAVEQGLALLPWVGRSLRPSLKCVCGAGVFGHDVCLDMAGVGVGARPSARLLG
jgi:hypothetical protein